MREEREERNGWVRGSGKEWVGERERRVKVSS